MRTLEADRIWLREGASHQELPEALARWVVHDNTGYPQSALGYKSPKPFEQDYHPAT